MTTTPDDIYTASPERLSEIAATEVMGWIKQQYGEPDWFAWFDEHGDYQYLLQRFPEFECWEPHEDRNQLWLVLEKVPEEKRADLHAQVWLNLPKNDPLVLYLYAPPDVVLRCCLEVLLG